MSSATPQLTNENGKNFVLQKNIIFIDITYSIPRLRGCARISVPLLLLSMTRDQALRFTQHVPARRVAPAAPVREYFGRCSILERSESWALYDSVPMTRTDGSTHDSSDDMTMIIQQ